MIGHIKSGQYLKNIARAILKEYCPPHKARGIHDFILATKSSVWIIKLYIFDQEIYGDNGRIYQIYKKMLTPNYGCVGATFKFTCSDTVFTSLVMCFFMLTIVQLLVLLILS